MTTPCEIHLSCIDIKTANKCVNDIVIESKRLEVKYNYFNPTSYLL